MSRPPAAGGDTRIHFEGQEISCWADDTVAAALMSVREYACRETDAGVYRGVFCGMGICQDCLVMVDGQPDRRACMTRVRDAMQVQRNPSRRRLLPEAAPQPLVNGADAAVVDAEIVVLGGGPAGLTAASVAAELGADVVLLDERDKVGGQFFKQAKSRQRVPPALQSDKQATGGTELIQRAVRSGARLVSDAVAWGVFDDRDLAVSVGGVTQIFRPQQLIIAAGAYERGVPIPGWTLPGVMTTGAAQTLMRSHGVVPGQRVLVAGNGPLNFQVAVELSNAGAHVVALLELANPFAVRSATGILRMLHSNAGLTLSGLRLLRELRSAGVPVKYGHGIAAIEATDNGLSVQYGRFRSDQVAASESADVDAVCMGAGFLPANELLRLAGCKHRFDAGRMQLVVERDDNCATSRPGIFAIGDCCGLGGAPAAMQEAVIAATAAVASLPRQIPPTALRQSRSASRQLRRERAFQAALWSVYRAPRFNLQLAESATPVCRCENVTLAELDAAISAGNRSLPAIKRATRLGMGPCQGRYCASLAMSRLVQAGVPVADEYAFFAPRAPLKPVSLQDLVNVRRTER